MEFCGGERRERERKNRGMYALLRLEFLKIEPKQFLEIPSYLSMTRIILILPDKKKKRNKNIQSDESFYWIIEIFSHTNNSTV